MLTRMLCSVCFELIMIASLALAQTLPFGFTHSLVAGGFTHPIGLAHLPDGRILIIQQDGTIHVVAAGQQAQVGTIPEVRQTMSEGARGIAVDPSWPARPYIYVQYSHALTPFIHVSRFALAGDLTDPASTNLTLGSRYLLLTDLPDQSSDHNGGTVRFSLDGRLYVSLGDDGDSCSAQDPSQLKGSILRLNISGLPPVAGGPPSKAALIPLGNPFAGPDDNARLTWAVGLRNPFRFHLDPLTGTAFIADVGSSLYEEINVVSAAGVNLGWPLFEGPDRMMVNCPVLVGAPTSPTVAISRAGSVQPASVISLGVYRNQAGGSLNFGPVYEGTFFYVDYFDGVIRRLEWNGAQWTTPAPVPGQPGPASWGTGFLAVTDADVGPDGGLYYISRVLGQVRSIKPAGSGETLSVVSGDNQVGTAGRPLPQPLVVRLDDAAGNPIAGTPVTFQDIYESGGVFGQQPAVTNTAGIASTTYTVGLSPPALLVSSPSGATLSIAVVWRGLGVAVSQQGGQTQGLVILSHSQVSSPFTFIAELPVLTAPIVTPVGDIWTSILNPSPASVILDGLGLAGPANPAFVTGAVQPVWLLPFVVPPQLAGSEIISQAFAVDTSLPFPESILITNAVLTTFP